MEVNNNVKKASRLGVICYGLGDLASQFVWTFVGSYLTIFYTDIVGFALIVVSGIMLIARVSITGKFCSIFTIMAMMDMFLQNTKETDGFFQIIRFRNWNR